MSFYKLAIYTSGLMVAAVLSFNITYDRVLAQEEAKALEKSKTEVVFKPYNSVKNKKNDKKEDISKTSQEKKPIVKSKKYIFVGDSRVFNYSNLNKEGMEFLHVISQDNSLWGWENKFVRENLEKYIKETKDIYNIVFNLSINNLNKEACIKNINKIALDYPNHNFFVVGINPVDEIYLEKVESLKNGNVDVREQEADIQLEELVGKYDESVDTSLNNTDITRFNRYVRDSLNENVRYIDTHKELIINGFETTNGVLYSNSTQTNYFNFIKNYISSL